MADPVHTEHVYVFAAGECSDCKRDEDDNCPILADAFRAWPVQWVGSKCSAYFREGYPDPGIAGRCPHTKELPL